MACHILFCFCGPWWTNGTAPSSRTLKMPISAPPITDIHKARSVNSTGPGVNSKAKACLKRSLRPPPALPKNGRTNKHAFQAKQARVQNRAFARPKNTPQKRPQESVAGERRRKRPASRGPTSRVGHAARSRSAPGPTLPICLEYSAASTSQISKLSSSVYQIHLLLCLARLSDSV